MVRQRGDTKGPEPALADTKRGQRAMEQAGMEQRAGQIRRKRRNKVEAWKDTGIKLVSVWE